MFGSLRQQDKAGYEKFALDGGRRLRNVAHSQSPEVSAEMQPSGGQGEGEERQEVTRQ